MVKKLLLGIVLILCFFNFTPSAYATNQVNVYFFWGEGCPHCAHEKPFLQSMEDENPEVKVYGYEVWKSSQNRNFLIEVSETLEKEVTGVPFTVVGNETFTGFSASVTAPKIESRIKYCLTNSCPDSVADIVGVKTANQADSNTLEITDSDNSSKSAPDSPLPEKLKVPFLGEIKTQHLSLPLFTIILGALDGFNPCAMWTLLFLISLLLGMKNTKRRWLLGITFIVASAFVYFLFMAAWLNLLLFIGFIVWVRIAIASIALGGGIYYLREFLVNKSGACKVTGNEKRQVIFEKLKNVTLQKSFVLAFIGIILLAFAVNLVELICSAGLPVIFTQVLTLSNLPSWQYYLYMLLYIFVFMLDDLFIFFTAMFTLEMTGVSSKYSHLSHLVGGVAMVIIGLLLLLNPELLMFG